MSTVQVDTINESTTGSGVTVDGVLIKDNAVNTDTISEKTSGSGVTVDSVLLKDGVAHSGLVKLASATPSGASEIQFANFVDNSTYSKYKIILEEVIADTDAAVLYFTFLDASDADVSGTYKKSGYYAYMDTTGHSFLGNSTSSGYGRTAFNFGNVSEENFTCEIDFYPNNTKNIAKINNRYIGEWSGGTYLKSDEAYTLDTSTAIKGIRYYMSTGNISATKATLYGVKK